MAKTPRLPSLTSTLPRLDTRTALPDTALDAFQRHYRTPEHRAWRTLVVERAGGRCQWPGCSRQEPRMFADHIHELRDGGDALDPANGQCLCGQHHSEKTAKARAERMARRH